jgi:TonB-dependent receptor
MSSEYCTPSGVRLEKHKMRRILSSTLLSLLCFCLLGTVASAQSGKGSLSGRVADAEDAVLQGARVELLPSAGTVTTNGQGEFTITNLAPGTYTVMISYVGFEPFVQDVTITAGKNTQLRAVINIMGKNEEVTVFTERQSAEVEAINRTRAAENILQVLPAEVITSLPNANIADALGRMPSVTIERDEGEGKYVQIRGTEPRLTNVMVDGITIPSPESGVRQIKLDTIASDLVESVEINKTLQANIDADGIGGSVNLRTKTAGEDPTITLYGLGGHTPIANGRNVMQMGGTLGKRLGEQKRLGVLFGGTYDYNGRAINDIEPSPTVYGEGYTPYSSTPHYDSIDLRDYIYNRTRWGMAGSVDYKLREGSGLYLRGLFSTFRNWGTKWTFTLQDNNDPSGYSTGAPKVKQDWRRPNMAIGNLVAGGKHVFSSSWLAWDVSASRSRSDGGNAGNGDAEFKWAGDPNIPCYNNQSLATSVNRPGWSAGCWGTGADNAMDQRNYKLKEFNLPGQGISPQVNLQGSASYARNYHVGTHFGTLEFGGKIRNAHKFDNSYDMVLNMSGTEPVANHPEWASDFSDPHYYGGTYKYGTNLVDYSKVRAWANASGLGYCVAQPAPNSVTWGCNARLNTGDFDLVERISAGYVMNTIDLNSRMRLVTGLRLENTYLNTLSYGSVIDPTSPNLGNLISTNVDQSYLDVMPSASLRISLDKDSGLRLVYGRGLGRPDPEMVTAAIGDTGNTQGGLEIYTKGNPALKAEYSDNFDVLYERYLQPIGLFQAGYFYKRITDPLIQVQFPITTGSLAGQGIYQEWENAANAHVQGIEIGFQQHLSYLPGPMHFLGLSANYSYTQSQLSGFKDPVTGFAYRTDKPAMLRQAPNTWNISPTFDTKKFSMRMGMTFNDKMIYAYQWFDGADPVVGIKGPSGDNYLYSHFQLDAQASYNLPYGLQVYAYGLNLNNEVFGFYDGSPQYVTQREYYKPTYAAGLRYNFSRER